ncbi:MAG: FAD-dependent oxidoreductase [Lachnospiraceae bacterium]|nr:FAD-dependent oxidoreductase [Lachnospiraceae bacterium]
MKNNAEVVIIGGGIIGCAAAYYLAKEGVSVIVLEKSDHIGNGGGVRQSGRDPRELPLAMYGVEHLWPTLSEELGVNVEYHKEGNLRLGKTEKHREILQGLTDRDVALGLDVRMIDGKEVRDINPYLSDEITVASWCPTDGHANPLVATLGYYKRARELGALFITGEDVVEIRKIRGKARQVVTRKNVYEGETIILASGYESRDIAATVGIDIPMRKELIEALVTEAEPKMFNQMLGTADADFYGHQTEHGSFVFGGASGFEAENRDNGHMITSGMTAPCICRGIMKYIPKLADAKIVRTWAGYEDLCADGVPVISPVEEAEEMELLPKQQISVVVETERVDEIVEIIKEQLYTGHIGDGKIFFYQLDNVIRVRTGDEGVDAL